MNGNGAHLTEKLWLEEVSLAETTVGAPVTGLRINAPYGPRQRTKTVIATFLDLALRRETLTYFGKGARQQDFCFVDDVAAAFVAALSGPGGVFNIAGGEPVSMLELAHLVAEVAGMEPSAVAPAGRPDPQEEQRVRFNLTLARCTLKWLPRVELREGISRCLAALRTARQ